MRFLFVLTILFTTFVSCQREISQMHDNDYSINLIRKFIPENIYKKSKTILFINSEKIIKEFQISYNQFKVTDLENRNFNKEVYTLQEQDNSLYFITLTAQPELHNNVVYERLYVKLLTSLNQGLISRVIIDQNGETWFNPKKDEITLLGKSFNDVYIGEISKQDVIACNRIYYTSNEGVVGFTDENGELWVLHEIK